MAITEGPEKFSNTDLSEKIFPDNDYTPIPIQRFDLEKVSPFIIFDEDTKSTRRKPIEVIAKTIFDIVTVPALVREAGEKIDEAVITTGLTQDQLVGELAKALAAKFPRAGIVVINPQVSPDLSKEINEYFGDKDLNLKPKGF